MTSLDTIRWRIILGLSGLLAGLVIAALVGITSLGTLRRSLATEIERLRVSSEVGNGLVTAVFDEIRAAEQYLSERGDSISNQFQGAVWLVRPCDALRPTLPCGAGLSTRAEYSRRAARTSSRWPMPISISGGRGKRRPCRSAPGRRSPS